MDTKVLNIGDLARPATALIEKVSEGIGGLCAPWQMKRMARAEADAANIHAVAQLQIGEIQQRSLIRLLGQEVRIQENIESITEKAFADLAEDAKPEKVDNDWIAHFFDKCKLVSNSEMQGVWAKILAGEANRAGTFSKRSLDLVSTLDKADADLFTSFCGFVWTFGERFPIVFDAQDEIYARSGINFKSLSHLCSLGLVSMHALGLIKPDWPRRVLLNYYGQLIVLTHDKGRHDLKIGVAVFTQAGSQLAPICGSKPVDGFIEYTIKEWSKNGIVAFSPYPHPPNQNPSLS